MRVWLRRVGIGAVFAAFAAVASAAPASENSALTDALAVLKAHRFVDLTHAFAPGIPHWKGAPDERVKTLYTVDKDGFRINEYCHIGQWGTHVDPPAHFHTGLHSVDQIDLKDMLMPLVVIDVHDKVAKNPDYVLSLSDVAAWESRHGPVPKGAFVAMRTSCYTRSGESRRPDTRPPTRIRARPPPTTTIRSSRMSSASITIRSNSWPTWTRCRRRAPSSGLPFRKYWTGRDFRHA